MTYDVYWKSAHATIRASASHIAQRVKTALEATDFVMVPDTDPEPDEPLRLRGERINGLPGLPFTYVWTAQIDNDGGRETGMSIEYGLRATLGTWIAFAATIVAIVPLFFLAEAVPALMMIPMAPLVWLFCGMIAMKILQHRLERRLWENLRSSLPVTEFSTSVRAVE